MTPQLLILMAEALAVYALVLGAHALRRRFGLAHFYALIGGLTAVMSWVTDANVVVEVEGISFWVGSTVFYTSILLGAFVVYVFDGPRATRIAISTVVGVSILVPVIALVLHLQAAAGGAGPLVQLPTPSLRINAASVFATLADLVFLGVAWEILGRPAFRMHLALRAFLTLLGVMWLDVILFASGAFGGTPEYFNIMAGTFLSRFVVSVFAFPVLFAYLAWQRGKTGVEMVDRPVLAILSEVAEVRRELTRAQEEIEHRKRIEAEKEELIRELREVLSEVKTLRGLLPICAHCRKIRNDQGFWERIETYIEERSDARFSHGICPDCVREFYPELADED